MVFNFTLQEVGDKNKPIWAYVNCKSVQCVKHNFMHDIKVTMSITAIKIEFKCDPDKKGDEGTTFKRPLSLMH